MFDASDHEKHESMVRNCILAQNKQTQALSCRTQHGAQLKLLSQCLQPMETAPAVRTARTHCFMERGARQGGINLFCF